MKIKSLIILSLIITAATSFTYFIAPRIITEIRNPIFELAKSKKFSPKIDDLNLERDNVEILQFKTHDEIKLSAFISYTDKEEIKGTIILLHGIRSSKKHFKDLWSRLADLGYNSIALDLRAHGDSEGQHCTFGAKEKKDISSLIDNLLMNPRIDKNIGIWGQSLGGAIALQVLAYDKRIKFGIVESTFSDLKSIIHDYFEYHAGFNIKYLTNFLIQRSGEIAGFDPDAVIPLEDCKNIEQPILLVHGNKDQRISIKYAQMNFTNIISNLKEFLEIKNANHLNVWRIGGKDYFYKVIGFIKKQTLVNLDQLNSAEVLEITPK
ncbi:alpha/beta hydrolase [Aureibacter tunicatorum]|uniref:Pimeloyl-ACP methyl ester carboxylesterase n=1 Tax=Aureibacter tunicatorum TaxID=866807 RepID=A0AAE3XMU3_9BACT|nr:alpha/beta fold hydrolase [Aureibacter tunicatorum]MDR6240816.1 pimeloyl-ACP methyl ester carboxylesterase [Aureibacter tunicatorum]BDD06851.1 hypothetical protein AUTU_43340 [Aureibacter tunicatorum]